MEDMSFLKKYNHIPTDPFIILEPQDQEIGEIYEVQELKICEMVGREHRYYISHALLMSANSDSANGPCCRFFFFPSQLYIPISAL